MYIFNVYIYILYRLSIMIVNITNYKHIIYNKNE